MTYDAAPERYDSMTYRFTGRSGLRLPALSLGLWQNFGTDRPEETQRAILRRAFDRGVTFFDNAPVYGYGSYHKPKVVIVRPAPKTLRSSTLSTWATRPRTSGSTRSSTGRRPRTSPPGSSPGWAAS